MFANNKLSYFNKVASLQCPSLFCSFGLSTKMPYLKELGIVCHSEKFIEHNGSTPCNVLRFGKEFKPRIVIGIKATIIIMQYLFLICTYMNLKAPKKR